jgi:hypothetical protein
MSRKNGNKSKNKELRGWLVAVALFLSLMLPREILAQPLTAAATIGTAMTATLVVTCP